MGRSLCTDIERQLYTTESTAAGCRVLEAGDLSEESFSSIFVRSTSEMRPGTPSEPMTITALFKLML